MTMICRNLRRHVGAPILFALGMAALAPGAALAQFSGGGSVFAFTDQCDAGGFPTGAFGVVAVPVRYSDTETVPGLNTSQVTIGFFGGSLHYALWRRSMSPTGTNFLGGTGRSIFATFRFAGNRPRVRVIQRQIVTLLDPDSPATLQNARSLVLRLRIQNFSDIQGCAATLAATLRRS